MDTKNDKKSFFSKIFNKETITYVFFGVLTTLVNYASYYLFYKLFSGHDLSKYFILKILFLDKPYLLSNVIAWIIAVTFAFITNKLLVFDSKSFTPKILLKEIWTFLAARLFSLLIEQLGLILLVDVMHINYLIAKIILAVIVVILNYFFSKLIIFKNKA